MARDKSDNKSAVNYGTNKSIESNKREKHVVVKQRGRSNAATATQPGALAEAYCTKDYDAQKLKADDISRHTAGTTRNDTSKMGKTSARVGSNPGVYAVSNFGRLEDDSRTCTEISQMEQDVISKRMGRAHTIVATKPGAHNASNFRSLEDDIVVKQKVDEACTSQMKKDILSNQKGRANTVYKSAIPGAHAASNFRSLEDDIVAKQTASKPASEISQFEQDITSKRMGRANKGVAAKPGVHDVSNFRSLEDDVIVAKQNATRPPREISQIEQNVLSKQMGRANKGVAAKPGAHDASTFRSFENDIVAKQTASRPPGEISQIEQDVLSKQMGRANKGVAVKPGAHAASNFQTLEDDILAKQIASKPASEISQFEQDITSKRMGRVNKGVAVKPSAHDVSTFRSFENDIVIKESASKPPSEISQIEQDIISKRMGRANKGVAAKPGAHDASTFRSLEDDIVTKESASKPPCEISQIEQDVLSKQTGRTNEYVAMKHSEISLTNINSTDLADATAFLSLEADILELEDIIATKRALVASLVDQHSNEFGDMTNGNLNELALNKNSVTIPRMNSNDYDITLSNSKSDIEEETGSYMVDTDHGKSESEDSTAIEDVQGRTDSPTQNHDEDSLDPGEGNGNKEEGLAVAFAVEDDENGMINIPCAIEFDPDAKPPMYRNRRFRLYVCFMLAISAIGATGAIVFLTMTQAEVVVEIPYRTTLGIRENIEQVISTNELNSPMSPYRKALDWIMFNDPKQLTVDSPQFFQRYILSYFYFASIQNGPWTNGCDALESEQEECNLKYLGHHIMENGERHSLNLKGRRWLSVSDECEWVGVRCDTLRQVVDFDLSGGFKMGEFPEGLTLLPYVHTILFNYIEIIGTLPNSIWNMKHLQRFDGGGNQISGTLSDEIFNSPTLQQLILAENNVTGSFPKSFGHWYDGKDMVLAANYLTGTIPNEIGDLGNLASLTMYDNKLSGTIPTTFGRMRMSTFTTIYLSRNLMTGTIPNVFDNFVSLSDYFVDDNLLTGTIPESIYECPNIHVIYVGKNKITGTISNKISKATTLKSFSFSNNEITGTLTERYGESTLEEMDGKGNSLNGTVPAQLCNFVKSMQLGFLMFDCLETPIGGTNEPPEIICPIGCCTICCDRSGEFCTEVE